MPYYGDNFTGAPSYMNDESRDFFDGVGMGQASRNLITEGFNMSTIAEGVSPYFPSVFNKDTFWSPATAAGAINNYSLVKEFEQPGSTGATGGTGPQGPQGATGPEGPAGTNGTNGTNGDGSDSWINGDGTIFTDTGSDYKIDLNGTVTETLNRGSIAGVDGIGYGVLKFDSVSSDLMLDFLEQSLIVKKNEAGFVVDVDLVNASTITKRISTLAAPDPCPDPCP